MKYHTITKEAAVAFRRIIFWAGVVACAASCQDEERMPGTDTGGLIAFRILEGNPDAVTRTASGNETDGSFTSVSGSIPMVVGGDTIEMGFTAERNSDLIFAEKTQTLTRGASFGNDDGGKVVSEFKVKAFRDNSHEFGVYSNLDDKTVTVSNQIGRTDIYWPAGSLSFCAYAWSKENADVENLEFKKTAEGLSGSFTYSLPDADTNAEEDKRNDPANQADLVFAMTPDIDYKQNAKTGPVDLLFHHALSAIVFKVGSVKAEKVILKSIALKNFYGSGKCQMSTGNIESSDDYNGRNNVIFQWETTGEQTNTYVLGCNGQEVLKSQQDNKKEHWFGEETEAGKKIGIEECTFMMIPQDFPEDSRIVLKFFLGDDEKEYTFLKSLKDITLNDESKLTEFKPDTKYIFTIGLNGDVDITVEDKVEGSTKKELTIQNTGVANGYIRAAIVGYWTDENGNVMDLWDIEKEESANKFQGLPGTDWKKGNDGFYYYQKSVPHNGYTSQLFTSYTLSEEDRNTHPNQTLILDIVGQIVIDDERVTAGWQTTFE